MTARCPVRTPVECALALGHDPPCSPRIEDEWAERDEDIALAVDEALTGGLDTWEF